MHDERDEDYEPEHDQYLDEGDDLDVMFAAELADEQTDEPSADTELPDDDDEFQGGLDDDF